ncbi:MAG: hypothetical protein ACT443_09260 [Gemmatimonadota bacterium]
MDKQKRNTVRIELTEEQRKKIQKETGRNASAIEFGAEELEERIAPVSFNPAADAL